MSTSSIRSAAANAETGARLDPESAPRAPGEQAPDVPTHTQKPLPDGRPTSGSDSQQPASRFISSVVSWSGRGARVLGRFVVDVVSGRRITGLLPSAPFVLRGAALAVAIMAIVYPIFTLAIPGALGWLAEVIVNLLGAYLLFVAADALCALNQLANGPVAQDSAAEE